MRTTIRRALLSVYDKQDLAEFARGLSDLGVELVSSASTAAALEAAGLPVTKVETVTGMPEMLDERVKTLHPKIHGGLLADRGKESHLADLERYEIEPFDLVVSNLYPVPRTAGDRHDRHRRTGDGARVGEEPRLGHDRHQPEPVRRAPRRAARQRRNGQRGDAPRASRSRRSRTRPRTTPRSCSGCKRAKSSRSTCSSRSNVPRTRCATARTRTSRRRATAGAASRAGGTPCSNTAGSRCRTSTSTTPTRRGSSCTTSGAGRRARSSSTRTRAVSRSPTISPTRTNARWSATNVRRSVASSR